MRFYVISESRGLVGTRDNQEDADDLALVAAVHTARTVYVHDREEEQR